MLKQGSHWQQHRLYPRVNHPFEELRCTCSGTFQLVRHGPQKSCGHGPAGAVLHPFSVDLPHHTGLSPHTVLKIWCPSLLPLSAHRSLPSPPVPLDSSQPFPPIYSQWVSPSRAACICSEDRWPCVQQPALLHAPSPRLTLLLHGHLAFVGSPAQNCRLEMDGTEAAWWAAAKKLLLSIFTGPWFSQTEVHSQ